MLLGAVECVDCKGVNQAAQEKQQSVEHEAFYLLERATSILIPLFILCDIIIRPIAPGSNETLLKLYKDFSAQETVFDRTVWALMERGGE